MALSDETFRHAAMQLDVELDALIELFEANDVSSFLEIGSKFGGTLWRVGNALPPHSRITSIDLNQNGTSLYRCVNALRDLGHDAELIAGDSRAHETIAAAKRRAPYHAILIDADHSEAAVEADWRNYGPMGRMICFHDIGWRKPSAASPRPIHGPALVWNRIKHDYAHQEILLDPEESAYGIGVLWRV